MKLLVLLLASVLVGRTVQAQQPTTPAAAPVPAKPPVTASAQSNDIGCRVLTGRVTDMFSAPLTGATVMLHGRDKSFNSDAFSTNAEGKYMLTSKQPIPMNTMLEITAAGYTSFLLPLANCLPLDVSLEPLPGTRFKSDGRIKKTSITGKVH